MTNFEIKDTDAYILEQGLDASSFEYLAERICLVDLSVRNNSEEEGDGVYLADIWLYGTDFYLGQNTELYAAANPDMRGSGGILLSNGEECDLTLVFNVNRSYFTRYAWNNMDSLEMKLYLTAFPVQKNIILQ